MRDFNSIYEILYSNLIVTDMLILERLGFKNFNHFLIEKFRLRGRLAPIHGQRIPPSSSNTYRGIYRLPTNDRI